MLRAADATDRFAHVPRVPYHWRMVPGSAAAGGKSDARRSNLAALQDAIDRSGRSARVAEYPWANRVVFDLRTGRSCRSSSQLTSPERSCMY